MCEQVGKKKLFSQCRFIDPGNHREARSTNWHYNDVPHYVYVELLQYDGDVFILETWMKIEDTERHTRDLLPLGTQSFDAVRIAIVNFDMYAKRVDAIAGEEL